MRTKFSILVLEFVEGGMLIRIKEASLASNSRSSIRNHENNYFRGPFKVLYAVRTCKTIYAMI